ncbi:MAG: 2Fe-2S iron-sulfur cluster-binding protein [Gammaproteobacteria bacterium]
MAAQDSLTLDGNHLPFTAGQTIMEAALAGGAYIPRLCHHPDLAPEGNCRLCTVSVNGRYQAACITPAVPGQVVQSATDELNRYRRTLLQMLFVEGNHVCPACEASGACQLQALAYYTGMLAPHFTHFYPRRPVDASHPQALIDFNRCILCGLCVRASRDMDGKNIFAVSGRGIGAHLAVNSPTGRLADTAFDITDKAAHVCPVGAILLKSHGFEIPIGERRYDRHAIDGVAARAAGAAKVSRDG